MYMDYDAGASFNMCADACLYDPRCGAFGWAGKEQYDKYIFKVNMIVNLRWIFNATLYLIP